jgi:Zn-dependent protease with chaperone function
MSAIADPATCTIADEPQIALGSSSSTPRLVALVLALLSAAGFCGLLIYNGLQGTAWVDATRICLGRVLGQGLAVQVVTGNAGLDVCRAPVESTRGWYALAAVAAVVLGAIIVAAVAPWWVERRRRLKAPGPRLAGAVDGVEELARKAGVRPPRVVLGSSRQRDAFTYGVPGSYRIVLPPALAIRPRTPAFEAAVGHEVQHIAHGDVALAWSLRGTGLVLAVMFLPALVLGTGRDPGFILDALWRAVLLAVVIRLALAAWLRAREHDADLKAARRAGTASALLSTLETLAPRREPTGGRLRAWWTGALANHPDPRTRVEILRYPDRLPVIGLVDGLTLGFTAVLTLPLVDLVLGPVLSGRGRIDLLSLVTATLVGPVMGASLGLGLWHHAALRSSSGRSPAGIPVALGVLVGGLAGQAASPAGSGLGGLGGLAHPATALLIAGGLAGATLLLAGLGELWAGRRASASGVPSIAAVLLGAALVTATLWAGSVLQLLADAAGYGIAALAAMLLLPETPVALLALVLAGVALVGVAVRFGRGAALRVVALGAAAGAVGALAIVVFRLTQGPASSDAAQEGRFYAYLAMTAITAAAAGLVLQVLRGPGGAGEALAAATVSALVTTAGFLAFNTVLGGTLTATFSWTFARPALGLTLVVLVGTASLGLIAGLVRRPLLPVRAAVVALAVIGVSGLAAGGALAARAQIVPRLGTLPSAPNTASTSTVLGYYKREIAPLMASGYADVLKVAGQILQNSTISNQEKASALRQTFLPELRSLYAQAQTFQGDGADVARVNVHLAASLRAEISAFESAATAYETGDSQTMQAAQAADRQAKSEFRTWQSMLK